MGKVKFEIPFDVIETFSVWNAESFKNDEEYDKLMVEALLLVFVNPDEITVHDDVRKFIKS